MCFDLVVIFFGFHMIVGFSWFAPMSSRILFSHIASQDTVYKALYIALVKDKETIVCFMLLHDTISYPILNA